MHVGGFQALPGHSRRLQGLQGPPGPSRSLQGPPRASGASRGLWKGCQNPKTRTNVVLNEKCGLPRTPKAPNLGARLKFHAGWSGWTRPPTMAGGGGGVARLRRVCKGGVEGVFKGI